MTTEGEKVINRHLAWLPAALILCMTFAVPADVVNTPVRTYATGYDVNAVDFSPNGSKVVLGCPFPSGVTLLLDTRTGAELGRYAGDGERVQSVAYAPNGSSILIGRYFESDAVLWDVATGEVAVRLPMEFCTSVAFSADATRLMTANSAVAIWDARTGARLLDIPGFVNFNADLSLNGRQVLTGGVGGNVQLWSGVDGLFIDEIAAPDDLISTVGYSSTGSHIFAAWYGGTASLWETSTRRLVRSFATNAKINCMAYSADGLWFAAGLNNQTAILIDVNSGRVVREFVGHTDEIQAIEFSPDSRFVLTGGWDGTARLWDFEKGQDGYPIRPRVFGQHLLDNFGLIDVNNDGLLTRTELIASTVFFLDEQFASLDTDGNRGLSEAELAVTGASVPPGGCACDAKSADKGIEYLLGDLLTFGMAMLGLLALHGTIARRGIN